MKNKLFMLGILVIALVFGMTVVNCDGGGGDDDDGKIDSSLVGTWVSDDDPTEEITFFSNGTVEGRKNGNIWGSGTITTSGNRYTIKIKSTGTHTGTFSVNGNKLTLTEDKIEGFDVYTKKN